MKISLAPSGKGKERGGKKSHHFRVRKKKEGYLPIRFLQIEGRKKGWDSMKKVEYISGWRDGGKKGREVRFVVKYPVFHFHSRRGEKEGDGKAECDYQDSRGRGEKKRGRWRRKLLP